jgi:hypothetical protein
MVNRSILVETHMQYLEYRVRKSVFKPDFCRMRAVLISAGYLATESDIERLWDDYSSASGKGWIATPEQDAELLEILLFGFGVGSMPVDEVGSFRTWPSYWKGVYPE